MPRAAILMTPLVLALSPPVPVRAEVRWAASWDDALRQASVESKFIVLDVATSWCGPCQWMAREVYPDPLLGEFSKTQVFYMVDG